jgi:endonuclease/exonuclease/phosphatase family metal-dependent hydrolase
MAKHVFMTWNLGFAARKRGFIADDYQRASKIATVIETCQAEVIALQELANRSYLNGTSFSLEQFFSTQVPNSFVHFEPALSLGIRHFNPFGKIRELRQNFGIVEQAQGPGIWHCAGQAMDQLHLRNLYSDQADLARVEMSQPMPHSLYMGDSKSKNAGRDEEDRPILWARLSEWDDEKSQETGPKLYFMCIQLPTLRGERETPPVTTLSERQKEICDVTLGSASVTGVDDLGSKLRVYCLLHIISQAERIEKYWEEWGGHKCVFILAGDFNFEHNTRPPVPEYNLLTGEGFIPVKVKGYTRSPHPPDRLVDNIWVKGVEKGKLCEILPPASVGGISLSRLSDHYPVIAEIDL